MHGPAGRFVSRAALNELAITESMRNVNVSRSTSAQLVSRIYLTSSFARINCAILQRGRNSAMVIGKCERGRARRNKGTF